MLIEFSITNFRSLKGKTTLNLVADGYLSKPENINTHLLSNGKELRLHNTCLIFGSNGSGKSNIIRGLFSLLHMLKRPLHSGEPLLFYDPFKFNLDSKDGLTKYTIKYLVEDGTPYQYDVAFIKNEIKEESLKFWPNGKETEAFSREIKSKSDDVHYLKIGHAAREGKTEEKVYKNNFGISHFSSLSPNEIILKAFNALKKISVINTLNDSHRKNPNKQFGKLLAENSLFRDKMNSLVKFSDLNINLIKAEIKPDADERKGNDKYAFRTQHHLYDGDELTPHELDLSLEDESQGSQTVIGLGGEIILTLDSGGVLLVDEFETSLHPKLSKALIQIFQNEKLNPKKAQLIFTTHDTNLMDHKIFRRDQIWFTDKTDMGETELFSMIDFDNLREGHVFEKWYMSGKFGALPSLDKIENIFG